MTDAKTPSVNLSPSDYVIIGGTGDLALRKILPALFWRYLDGQITSDYRIAAASRRDISPEDYAGMLRPFCEDAFSGGGANEDDWTGFLALISMITLDVQGGAGGDHLAGFINERADSARPTIFYLAIAPSLFGDATRLLRDCGLATPQARLVVEKPLGHDGASSRAINAELAEIFDESQIYRIDHYLGKETVQNLMALRFANVIFETQWNNNHIDHV
ncbi:MAG: glucose-6-phosphate dehydrogenase, partial [Pseudomonadota bacterium]|nr:glucose-6-phosphate dehydrogenase [Pseudomonadota bacterium]